MISRENDAGSVDAVAPLRAPLQNRLLEIVARELEDEILPALADMRARTTARMLIEVLRYTILDSRDPSNGDGASAQLDAWTTADGALCEDAIAAIREERDFMRQRIAAEAALSLPRRRDAEDALFRLSPDRLEDYFQRHGFGADFKVSDVQRLFGGFSKETYVIDYAATDKAGKFVLRRDKKNGAVETSVIDEFRVVQQLHGLGLPVAPPVMAEPDSSYFGQPFAVTEWLPGGTASNTQGMTMDAGQVVAARELAAFLGRLHAVDPAAANLRIGGERTGSAKDHLLADIERSEASWRRRSHPSSAILLSGYAWLKANVPELRGFQPRIVHGDAGLHNIMIHDGRISAMLDWELTHLGDPVEDLAYCRTWVDQVLPWTEFLDIYYRHGGPEYHPERQDFYGVLANIRIAAFSANCVDIINRDDYPELGWAIGGTNYRRVFKLLVADRLLKVHAETSTASK